MPAVDELPVALERLVALGQSPDVNIRPVLLRVVVDMFVRKPHHAPADLSQFETIVSHLLDDADAEAKLIVADKLSKHPATPRMLLERFVAEQGSIAAKVYEHAALDDMTLSAAAAWSHADIASVVARRKGLPPGAIAALMERPEPEPLRGLAANLDVELDRPGFQHLVRRARDDHELAMLLAERPADPIDLAPLFLVVQASQRQAIIEAARRTELGRRQWGRSEVVTNAALEHLDQLILCGERDSFDAALANALGIESGSLVPLLSDEGGEILALALAAIGMSPEQAARVFILGDASIGRSLPRVRAMVRIVETVAAPAARKLIVAMTGSEATRRSGAPTRQPTTSRRTDTMLPAEVAQPRRDVPALAPARRVG